MPSRQSIAQLVRSGQVFDETFLLVEKELRPTKTGKLFIRGVLQDRTGQCPIVVWEATERFYEALPRGGFVRARGRVEIYQNKPQLIVDSCVPVDESQLDLSDFLPATTQDVKALEKELRQSLRAVRDPGLRAVADAFLDDVDLMAKFCRAPAAKVNHHAYLGGLLEHTVAMLRTARQVLPLYPVLNADLLLVGIFLHDIGKIDELAYARVLDYTDSGRLVGHLVLGAMMLQDKVARLRAAGTDIPDILLQQLVHLILAHHGEYEFGSPKLPITPEAVAVHYLDNLDAKLQAFREAVDTHPADEESWTGRQFMFDNQMLFRGTAEDRQRRRSVAAGGPSAETGDDTPQRKGGLD